MNSAEIRKTGLSLTLIGLLLIGPKMITQYAWEMTEPDPDLIVWTSLFAIVGLMVASAGIMCLVNTKNISGERYKDD